MHGARVLRREGQASLFRHRQSVHVAADQDALARLFAAGQGHQAALADLVDLIPHLFQLGTDVFYRLKQLVPQLGMAVKMPPVFHQFGNDLVGAFQIFVHWMVPPFCISRRAANITLYYSKR